MTEGTALVETERFTDLVREGALLNGDDWGGARIAAARKLLPPKFQDTASMIAFLAIAQRTGLDPFIREMWAWEQQGRLQFMTARDGWIRLASDDPTIEGLEFGHVYSKDEFAFSIENGKVSITHTGSMDRGELVGAYCCAHRSGEADDHLERRLVADYVHLFGKDNWKQYPQDMLLTRVISSCVKMVCNLGASLYSEADVMFKEGGHALSAAVMAEATDVRADALRERLSAGSEVTALERGPGLDAAQAATETPPAEGEGPMGADIAGFVCPECERTFSTERGRSLHINVHRRAAEAVAKSAEAIEALEVEIEGLPEGYICLEGGVEGTYDLWGPDGTIILGEFQSTEAVLEAALTRLYSVAEDVEAGEAKAKMDAVVEAPAPGLTGIDFYKWVEEVKCDPQRIRDAMDDPANGFARFNKGEGKVNVFELDNEARWRLVQIIES